MQSTADRASLEPAGERLEFLPGIAVPLPDEAAALAAWERLSSVDIGVSAPTIAGLGMLAEAVAFIAGVQAHPVSRGRSWSTRVVLVTGSHSGGVVAGSAPDPRKAVPLQHSHRPPGPASRPSSGNRPRPRSSSRMRSRPSRWTVRAARWWAEAERAADEGIEMLILAAGGPGASAAAVAVISAISGHEATRPARAGWDARRPSTTTTPGCTRCLALRDARCTGSATATATRGRCCRRWAGSDLAAAPPACLLGAASRRLPVMIDGPVGAAAAMLAERLRARPCAAGSCFPTPAAMWPSLSPREALELRPWLDLCLDLGEGADVARRGAAAAADRADVGRGGRAVEPRPLTRFDSATGGQVLRRRRSPGRAGPGTWNWSPREPKDPVGRANGTNHEHRGQRKKCGAARPAEADPGQGRAEGR